MAILNEASKRRAARGSRLRGWRVLCLFAWLLVVACVNFVPRQGWDPSAGPVVPHDSFPADCSLCHEGDDWHTLRADFVYDHGKETGVALEGAHERAGCLLCHNDRGPVQQFAARGCAGCHADPHLSRLGANCSDCHNERTWYPREAIAMHDTTRFPLVGAHAAAACFRCHPGAQVGNFAGTPAECSECHQDDFLRTANPNHTQVGFSQDCEQCHLPVSWHRARFDHVASFPLTFGHGGLACGDCHTTPNVFTGLSPDCATCHTDDFQATTDPAHAAAGFDPTCDDCHDTRTFERSSWPHPDGFALTFGHAGRRCSECHVGQVYSGTQSDCASCHLDDYQATTDPNHAGSGFPTDCQECHSTATWQGAVGEHPESFPLQNAHQRACTDCHVPGNYSGLDPSCVACHLVDWQGAANPSHSAFNLPQTCEQCHDDTTWGDGNWQHDFPINNGDHSGLDCFDCHDNPADRLQFSCINCHEHNQTDMADDHPLDEVPEYVWTTAACYACHPNGDD